MNFIKQFKAAMLQFEQYYSITSATQACYWHLFDMANYHNWQPFVLSQRELNARMNNSSAGANHIREHLRRLKNVGLIDYTTARKGNAKGTTITVLATYTNGTESISNLNLNLNHNIGGNNYEYTRDDANPTSAAEAPNNRRVKGNLPQRTRPIGS